MSYYFLHLFYKSILFKLNKILLQFIILFWLHSTLSKKLKIAVKFKICIEINKNGQLSNE